MTNFESLERCMLPESNSTIRPTTVWRSMIRKRYNPPLEAESDSEEWEKSSLHETSLEDLSRIETKNLTPGAKNDSSNSKTFENNMFLELNTAIQRIYCPFHEANNDSYEWEKSSLSEVLSEDLTRIEMKNLSPGATNDSYVRENSPLPEATSSEDPNSIEIEKHTPDAQNDSKEQEIYSVHEATSEGPSISKIKNLTPGTENGFNSVAPDELEFEIEMARREIRNHFMKLKIQLDDDDEASVKEMEIWTQGGLDNIQGGKNPQNEFFIKSLINNFEEIIGNIEQESKRHANQTADDIRKIFIKLVKRIELNFRPIPRDVVTAPGKDSVTFLELGLLSLLPVLLFVFPDYFRKIFGSAVAIFQSTILIVFLFSILFFFKPECK